MAEAGVTLRTAFDAPLTDDGATRTPFHTRGLLSQSVNGFVQSRPYATEHIATGRVLIWGENRVFDLSEGEARVWDAATGKALSEPMKHEAAVSGAAFDEHGERVLT